MTIVSVALMLGGVLAGVFLLCFVVVLISEGARRKREAKYSLDLEEYDSQLEHCQEAEWRFIAEHGRMVMPGAEIRYCPCQGNLIGVERYYPFYVEDARKHGVVPFSLLELDRYFSDRRLEPNWEEVRTRSNEDTTAFLEKYHERTKRMPTAWERKAAADQARLIGPTELYPVYVRESLQCEESPCSFNHFLGIVYDYKNADARRVPLGRNAVDRVARAYRGTRLSLENYAEATRDMPLAEGWRSVAQKDLEAIQKRQDELSLKAYIDDQLASLRSTLETDLAQDAWYRYAVWCDEHGFVHAYDSDVVAGRLSMAVLGQGLPSEIARNMELLAYNKQLREAAAKQQAAVVPKQQAAPTSERQRTPEEEAAREEMRFLVGQRMLYGDKRMG